MIIGLDWGSTTGIAVLDLDGRLVETDHVERKPACKALAARGKRPAREAVSLAERWGEYLSDLRFQIEWYRIGRTITALALEHPGHLRSEDQAGAYWRSRSACEEIAWRDRVALVLVPTGRVKITATGYGRAEKEAMILAARRQWPGFAVWTEHTADAAWVAETARRGAE